MKQIILSVAVRLNISLSLARLQRKHSPSIVNPLMQHKVWAKLDASCAFVFEH